MKQGETSPAEVLGHIFTKYQELLWKQGLEREYLRVGFSAPLFEDIEWPLMDSYIVRRYRGAHFYGKLKDFPQFGG